MADLENGTLVRHTSLGVGKIVAVEPNALHVFFPGADRRFAAKLRLPTARAMLRTDGFDRDAWLEGLSDFALDQETGRYALAATWLTQEQAIAQFLAVHPGGFGDAGYLSAGGRAARWRAAQAAWAARFGSGEGERLLADDDLKALVRRALEVEALVAPLHPPADEGALKAAFADEEATRAFFAALVELASVPSPGRARFEKLFGTAGHLPVEPAQQWLVATLFPFVASPDRHVLLRPKTTCEAAERLGCDLRYEPSPTWVTYAALRALSGRLLEALAPHGAKDFVDVEGFLHVTAAPRRSAKRGEAAAPIPKVRAVREARARTTRRKP